MFVAEAPVVPVTADPSARVDGLGRVDALIAGGLVLGVFFFLSIWAYPGFYPGVWQEAAEAAGIYPASTLLPGLWRVFAGGVFAVCGVGPGSALLAFLGRLSASVIAGLLYLFFRECLALSIRNCPQHARRRVMVARVASLLAAVVFACSEPAWRMGQAFSSSALTFLLIVLVLELFAYFLRAGSMPAVYVCAFLCGIVSAGSPLGFVLIVVCCVWYVLALRNLNEFETPLGNPSVEQVSKWHMTFLLLSGFLSVVGLNCVSFVSHDGLACLGVGVGSLPRLYVLDYWRLVLGAATLVGWLFLFIIVFLPCVLSAVLLSRSADEERFLPYGIGLLFLVGGVLAMTQLSALRALWIWSWTDHPLVSSQLLLLMVVALAAFTLLNAVIVLGVDALCRDHKLIATQMFGELPEEGAESPGSDTFGRILRNALLVLVPLAILVACVPGRRGAPVRQMMSIVQDYMEEVLDECRGAGCLFTDGKFDAGLELRARARHQPFQAFSFMAGHESRPAFVRMRGQKDPEDRLAAREGAPTLLRVWQHDRKDRLAGCAVQIGFELWKRDGRPFPPFSGLVSRPAGVSRQDLAAGVGRAHALGRRVLDFYAKFGSDDCSDPVVQSLFRTVQWRISRIARLRGESYDLAGQVAAANAEVALSNALDDKNASLREILEMLESVRQRTLRHLSPREGLQLALVRADFSAARQYAETVLAAEPDNADANFAMGMSYYQQGQFSRAEAHLRRCLIRTPNEPAVYNNLAMVQIRLRKFDAADQNAREALKFAPGSPDVLDTIRQVSDARAGLVHTNAVPSAASAPPEVPPARSESD